MSGFRLHNIQTLVSIVLSLSIAVAVAQTGTSNYTATSTIGGKRFEAYSGGLLLSWSNASLDCMARTFDYFAGRLATVGSSTENSVLSSLLTTTAQNSAWLGANITALAPSAMWVTGATFYTAGNCLTYCNWATTRPLTGAGNVWATQLTSQGNWQAATALTYTAYICEYAPLILIGTFGRSPKYAQLHTAAAQWTVGQLFCPQLNISRPGLLRAGGRLLSLRNQDQTNQVLGMLTPTGVSSAWLGGYASSNQNFQWQGPGFISHGSSCVGGFYCNWETNEPNAGNGAVAVSMAASDGKWSDSAMTGYKPFLCEFTGAGFTHSYTRTPSKEVTASSTGGTDTESETFTITQSLTQESSTTRTRSPTVTLTHTLVTLSSSATPSSSSTFTATLTTTMSQTVTLTISTTLTFGTPSLLVTTTRSSDATASKTHRTLSITETTTSTVSRGSRTDDRTISMTLSRPSISVTRRTPSRTPKSATEQQSWSDTGSLSSTRQSITQTESYSADESTSRSFTFGTLTLTFTFTKSPTVSQTRTPSISQDSPTASRDVTASRSPSESETETMTLTVSETNDVTHSVATMTFTASRTATPVLGITVTESLSPSGSVSDDISDTISRTKTPTPPSHTPVRTATLSNYPTESYSDSLSSDDTETRSVSETLARSPTLTLTFTTSLSRSETDEFTGSRTVSRTLRLTMSRTVFPTPTNTPSKTRLPPETRTVTPTITPPPTPTKQVFFPPTASMTDSPTAPSSQSQSFSASPSRFAGHASASLTPAATAPATPTVALAPIPITPGTTAAPGGGANSAAVAPRSIGSNANEFVLIGAIVAGFLLCLLLLLLLAFCCRKQKKKRAEEKQRKVARVYVDEEENAGEDIFDEAVPPTMAPPLAISVPNDAPLDPKDFSYMFASHPQPVPFSPPERSTLPAPMPQSICRAPPPRLQEEEPPAAGEVDFGWSIDNFTKSFKPNSQPTKVADDTASGVDYGWNLANFTKSYKQAPVPAPKSVPTSAVPTRVVSVTPSGPPILAASDSGGSPSPTLAPFAAASVTEMLEGEDHVFQQALQQSIQGQSSQSAQALRFGLNSSTRDIGSLRVSLRSPAASIRNPIEPPSRGALDESMRSAIEIASPLPPQRHYSSIAQAESVADDSSEIHSPLDVGSFRTHRREVIHQQQHTSIHVSADQTLGEQGDPLQQSRREAVTTTFTTVSRRHHRQEVRQTSRNR